MQGCKLCGIEIWYRAKPDDITEMEEENKKDGTSHCERILGLGSKAGYQGQTHSISNRTAQQQYTSTKAFDFENAYGASDGTNKLVDRCKNGGYWIAEWEILLENRSR